MNGESPTKAVRVAIPRAEWIARSIALAIIIAGIVDPAITIARRVKPVISIVTADSLGNAAALGAVQQRLADRTTPVIGHVPGATAQVVVGSRLPAAVIRETIPSFVVSTGTTHRLHFETLDIPDIIPLDARTPVSARIAREPLVSASGPVADTTQALLELREDGMLLDRRTLSLAAGARTRQSLAYAPSRAGAHVVDVHLIDGPDTVQWTHPVLAREQRWNVLVFDPRPSWLSTFVRRALEQDIRFDVRSHIVTSTNVGRATARAAPSINTVERLSPLPDVLIVGAPDALTATDAAALERLLDTHGVSVALLPDHLVSGGGLNTRAPALDALLGARGWHLLPPTRADAPRRISRETPAGSFTNGTADSIQLLATSVGAPHTWPDDIEIVASTMVTGASGSARSATDTVPVIWRRARGRGELLVSSAFDTWRFRDAQRSSFEATWRDLVAHAARQRVPRLRVTPDRDGRGAIVQVDDQVDHGDPTPPLLTRLGSQDTATVRLLPTVLPGTWRAVWSTSAETSAAPPALLRASHGRDTVFIPIPVHAPGARSGGDTPHEQLLAWATHSGGQVVPLEALDSLAHLVMATVGERRDSSPWHPMRSGWWIVPLTLAFGTEWWLRRRRGSP